MEFSDFCFCGFAYFQTYEYESNLRSNEQYLSSSEKKALKKIQACMGFELMSSTIPV